MQTIDETRGHCRLFGERIGVYGAYKEVMESDLRHTCRFTRMLNAHVACEEARRDLSRANTIETTTIMRIVGDGGELWSSRSIRKVQSNERRRMSESLWTESHNA